MIRMAITTILTAGVLLALAGCQQEQPTLSRQQELERQLQIRYENPQAHYELARLYQAQGNPYRAEFHYKAAAQFDPANPVPQAALVRLYMDTNQKQKADTAADIYIQQAGVSAARSLELGRAFHRQNLPQYAERAYLQAERLDRRDPQIPKQLGYFYLRQGNKQAAQQAFLRSFELDPEQADIAAELGKMGVPVAVPPRKAVDVLGPLKDVQLRQPAPDRTIK